MDEPEDEPCPECAGTGVLTYYVGTYGTSRCNGPAERTCEDCGGTGVVE